ncbi:alpha/beta fold hydrolase [Rhodococcus sp. NBC_00297]|uniref:alpha/beta fold hydrolase n=1 Tax=Rhodococcus sp. NBC_00297 TaxID=2976005 RepID=UPI002E280BA9|nr:alpha/beta hydrolase [Rhodococcus sp. NBC_00297]
MSMQNTLSKIDEFDVQVGEYSIRVHRAGEGNEETILFLHGSGPGATGMSNFSETIADLSDEFDCVVIDQVGFGESTHPTEAQASSVSRFEVLVETNLALLDVLGLERVHLVGNSLGGWVSQQMLIEKPERFGRAVCMGSAGMAPPGATPPPALLRLITFYDDATPIGMEKLVQAMLYDADTFSDHLSAIVESRLAVAVRPDVERNHVELFADLRGRALDEDALRAIPNDVLYIHGREDPVVPLESSERLVRTVPNAYLYAIPHCGHWAQVEHAARFNAATRGFLRGEL